MWVVRTILILIVIAIVVGVSIYNAGELVNIDLIRQKYEGVRLNVVLYWAFLAGMAVSTALGMTYVIKLHNDLRGERLFDAPCRAAQAPIARDRWRTLHALSSRTESCIRKRTTRIK